MTKRQALCHLVGDKIGDVAVYSFAALIIDAVVRSATSIPVLDSATVIVGAVLFVSFLGLSAVLGYLSGES